MKKDENRVKTLIFLHVMLMVYSLNSIFSKLASETEFLSPMFCLYYTGVIVLLGIYAIGWQQVIKRLPLSAAFANKAVTVVWGILWGFIFFREKITAGKLLGAFLIIAGVVLYAMSEEEESNG